MSFLRSTVRDTAFCAIVLLTAAACSGGGASPAGGSTSIALSGSSGSPAGAALASSGTQPSSTPSMSSTAISAASTNSVDASSVAEPMTLPAPTVPSEADAFVDSIGVDTHFSYGETSYVENFTQVSAALIASGIRHIRDGEPGDPHAQELTYLGQNGVTHSAGFPWNTSAASINETLAAYAPYVDFVEPQNEWDETARTNPLWASQIVSEQQLLYATIKSNPANANIVVLGPSFGNPANATATGNLDAVEDFGSEHDYPCSYNPGTDQSAGMYNVTNLLRAASSPKPFWTTEVGYSDDMVTWSCGLSDPVIAKFDPRTVAMRWLYGQPRTYFYQFADMAPAQNYNGMGLVTTSGAPKLQYTSLKSMIKLLDDRGSPFKPSALPFALTGNTTNVDHLLLQKRDGTYYLLLWLEVPGWNASTMTPIPASPQTVYVTLPSVPSAFNVFSYNLDSTLREIKRVPSRTVSIPVEDSIKFVAIRF